MKADRIRRMVVKLGTATIAEESGRISGERIESLAGQVAEIKARGTDVALVSSGAIACGTQKLGLEEWPADLGALQAVSAVGQGLLFQKYAGIFSQKGLTAGQVLLTQHDMTHRRQYLNARHTIERLFDLGVIPIINENDTVATEEITFGENDMLAALVASLIGADLLVLLTDTAGLYTADPRKEESARKLERVAEITTEIEALGGNAGSRLSSGGMSSKVQAVKVAVASGVPAVIADGLSPGVLVEIVEGKPLGTYFEVSGRELRAKKHWIGYAKKSAGQLVVDEGASNAVTSRGSSLLPAGVVRVEGDFKVGDAVDIVDPGGTILGKGLVNYSSDEARRIAGLRSAQVAEVMGETAEEIIHRDYLVVFDDSRSAE